MAKEKQNKINRRDAMEKILQIIAIASGMSISKVRSLLAADLKKITGKTPSVTKTSSVSNPLKLLKVKLSGYDKNVFINEYGRLNELVEIKPVIGEQKQILSCNVNFGGGIGPLATDGSSCDAMANCSDNGCSDQDWWGASGGCDVHSCGSNRCANLTYCDGQDCDEQWCGKLADCSGNNQKIMDVLNTYKTDIYVQNLMEHFNVTSVKALAVQVEQMIASKRTITPQELLK